MHLSDLYENPAIDTACYVHVKVLSIDVEDTADGPRVFIEMRVPPEQPRFSCRYLYAVLHPCLSAEYPRKKFREAFGIDGDDFEHAEGQWVAVRLVPAKYGGIRFSNVQFVAQTPISQQRSKTFAQLEADGEMPPWDDRAVAVV